MLVLRGEGKGREGKYVIKKKTRPDRIYKKASRNNQKASYQPFHEAGLRKSMRGLVYTSHFMTMVVSAIMPVTM